jgi:hypothetical protein
MKLHDADHQSKAAWKAINSITGNSVSKGIITVESDAEREKLWYNHFNNLLSPPSSAESNADNEELPTGIHQAFKDCYLRTETDMDELVLPVKSSSSDKVCGLDEVVTQIPKLNNEIHCLLLDMLISICLRSLLLNG